MPIPTELTDYYAAAKPLVCELDAQPFDCEFWPRDELEEWNLEYEVARAAPGFYGFASSGGGEMFAISPTGAVVALPFIGMDPSVALPIAPSWPAFGRMLREAKISE